MLDTAIKVLGIDRGISPPITNGDTLMLELNNQQAQEALDLANLLSDIHLLNTEEVELAIAETILEEVTQ